MPKKDLQHEGRWHLMSSALGVLSTDVRKSLRPAPQPEWTPLMLATLTTRTFSDPGWVFERKLDGERCLAFRQGRAVRLMSRNRKRVTNQLPEVVDALLAEDAHDLVVDGEVAASKRNQTSSPRLQRRMHVA